MSEKPIELSQQLLIKTIVSKSLYYTHRSRRELWNTVSSVMEKERPNHRYFLNTLVKMDKEKHITESFREERTPYLSLTEEGRAWYRSIEDPLSKRLQAVQRVAEAIRYDITKQGERPRQMEVLKGADRTFFSTIISAMDVFRYYVLRQALHQPYIVMSDMQEGITNQFGWHPSKAYIYQLAQKMEEEEVGALIQGKWDDPRFRRRRYWKVTEAGRHFYPRLEQDAGDRVSNAYYYLEDIQKHLKEN